MNNSKQVIVLFDTVMPCDGLIGHQPTVAVAVIGQEFLDEVTGVAKNGGGERDASAEVLWLGGAAINDSTLHISNSGFWFSTTTDLDEVVESRVEYLDQLIVSFNQAKDGDVLEVGSDVLLHEFLEAHTQTPIVLESMAIDEHGDAPLYAWVPDAGSLCSELLDLLAVLREHQIYQARQEWQPAWQDAGLRLSGDQLVVGADGTFWFVAAVSAAGHDVETRTSSVAQLLIELAQAQPGTWVYLGDDSNKQDVMEFVESEDVRMAEVS